MRPRVILDDGTPACLPGWAREEIVRLRLENLALKEVLLSRPTARPPLVDSAEIDSDERGFMLVLATDTEGTLTFRLPLEVGEQLDRTLETLRQHAASRDYERAAYDRATPEERDEVLGRTEIDECRG